MARPKPAIPVNIPFHVRITQGEDRAIDALVDAWVETNRKHGRIVDRTKNSWFRGLVHTLAAQAGIPIVDATADEAGSPTKGDKLAGSSGGTGRRPA